jgi:hypothetical protein
VIWGQRSTLDRLRSGSPYLGQDLGGEKVEGALKPTADLPQDRIKRRPVFGGLINEYERAA